MSETQDSRYTSIYTPRQIIRSNSRQRMESFNQERFIKQFGSQLHITNKDNRYQV